MKKLILSGLLLATTLLVAAQSKTDSTTTKKSGANGNNEIKLNVVYGILGLPELTYERILNDESAVGISVAVGADDDISWKFGVVPYYRVYFGGKKASGFFIEGNAALITIKDYDYSSYNSSYYVPNQGFVMKTQTSFGLGAAAGGKFLTKRGFIGEAYFGLGRLFQSHYEDIYPRMGITIGKRF